MAVIPAVTVANTLVPNLLIGAQTRATRLGVDISGMTQVQKGQWLVIQLLKDEYLRVARDIATAATQTAVQTAQTTELTAGSQAKIDADAGITP